MEPLVKWYPLTGKNGALAPWCRPVGRWNGANDRITWRCNWFIRTNKARFATISKMTIPISIISNTSILLFIPPP